MVTTKTIVEKLTFAFMIVILLTVHLAVAESKEKYAGSTLEVNSSVQCKSKQRVGVGFWRDILSKDVEKGYSAEIEPQETVWRIVLIKSKNSETAALVSRFSGATKNLEEPKKFEIETTSKGLLLVSADRAKGESPEVITIDVSNSSFVYTTSHINPLWNRTNVFIGSCSIN